MERRARTFPIQLLLKVLVTGGGGGACRQQKLDEIYSQRSCVFTFLHESQCPSDHLLRRSECRPSDTISGPVAAPCYMKFVCHRTAKDLRPVVTSTRSAVVVFLTRSTVGISSTFTRRRTATRRCQRMAVPSRTGDRCGGGSGGGRARPVPLYHRQRKPHPLGGQRPGAELHANPERDAGAGRTVLYLRSHRRRTSSGTRRRRTEVRVRHRCVHGC